MKYYILSPSENRNNIWLLGYDDMEKGHLLFEKYAALVCPNCGKVDEDAAIRMGLDQCSKIASNRDYVGTDDGFILVSRRFQEAANTEGIVGMRFIALGDSRYCLMEPEPVPTDVQRSGVEAHGPYGGTPYRTPGSRLASAEKRCVTCHRVYEHAPLPLLASMLLPENPMSVFTFSFRFEKQSGRETIAYASEAVRQAMRRNRLSGIEFDKAY
jgi:hypothetical protein